MFLNQSRKETEIGSGAFLPAASQLTLFSSWLPTVALCQAWCVHIYILFHLTGPDTQSPARSQGWAEETCLIASVQVEFLITLKKSGFEQ